MVKKGSVEFNVVTVKFREKLWTSVSVDMHPHGDNPKNRLCAHRNRGNSKSNGAAGGSQGSHREPVWSRASPVLFWHHLGSWVLSLLPTLAPATPCDIRAHECSVDDVRSRHHIKNEWTGWGAKWFRKFSDFSHYGGFYLVQHSHTYIQYLLFLDPKQHHLVADPSMQNAIILRYLQVHRKYEDMAGVILC